MIKLVSFNLMLGIDTTNDDIFITIEKEMNISTGGKLVSMPNDPGPRLFYIFIP